MARRSKQNGRTRRTLVLRIFHWEERYAIHDPRYPYDRGLLFIRLFVAEACTESTHYFGQLRDLRALVGEKYHHYRDVFHDTVSLAASLGQPYRGYLIDEQYQPLKDTQLATRLDLGLEETRTVLKALLDVHLIERIDLPDFDAIRRASVKQDQDKEGQEESRDGKTRAKKSRGAQSPASEVQSPAPGGGENSPGTVENADSGQPSAAPGGHGAGPESATPFISENGLNPNGNLNAQAKNGNGSAESQGQAEAAKANEGQGTPAVPSPPTTQPSKPKGAEGEGAGRPARTVGPNAPPRSDCTTDAGNATVHFRNFNTEAIGFGEWIYDRLGFKPPGDDRRDQEFWRREVAAYASIWVYACQRLTATQLPGFREWSIAEATRLCVTRNSFKNHVKKWMSNAKYRVRTLVKKAR
jgi:hypothetical protein